MIKLNLKNKFKTGWLIWILSIPAMAALVVPGYFGASDDLHIGWLFEMDRALRAGQIPPRFVPDLSFGFGYPLFNFVYPLPFYIAEIWHLLGFSLVDSIKLVFGLSLPLSGYLMYRWLRDFVRPGWALLGGLLYIYTPYRATDLYVRGAIGEVWSFVWLPLLGLAVSRIGRGMGGSRWVGLGAMAGAGLVLTHNITAYMMIPLFGLLGLGLMMGVARNRLLVFGRLVMMGVLALLISSYFWWPALSESNLVKYDTVFNYADHFPTLVQLIKPYWGYGASVPGPYDGMSFYIGFVNWVVLIGGVGMLIWRWRKLTKTDRVVTSWAIVAAGMAGVMMNYRSSWLWDNLPLIGYFQFPWRFLTVEALVIPLLIIPWQGLKFERVMVVGGVIGILLTSAFMFRPHDFLGRMDAYYLNRYIPVPEASAEYRTTGEEYLRLPVMTLRRPDQNYPLAEMTNGVIEQQVEVNALRTKLTVNASQSAILNYHKYNFPGWMALIDGQAAEIVTGLPFGQVQLALPQGQHQVEIWFGETANRLKLNLISLVALIGTIGLVLKRTAQKNEK